MVVVAVQARALRTARVPTAGTPLLMVDAGHPSSALLPPALFGLGADVLVATYKRAGDTRCQALPDAGAVPALIRIGADKADDYDWRTDSYATTAQSGRSLPASFPCTPSRPAGSVLRLLDRARALHAAAVVVVNGEIDDPQSAAGLVRLIAARYGLDYARGLYWEIGEAPARWQHFGVPLSDPRRASEHVACSPDQYAALVTSYAAAIAAALGNAAPRIVADDWIANATDESWTGVVTDVDTQYYPFNAPDPAPGAAQIAASLTARASDATDLPTLDQQLDNLHANLEQYQGGHDVRLFVGQWNLDASSQSTNPAYNSAGQAVFVARLLLRLARSGDRVVMAAWAPPLYGYPPGGPTQAPFFNGQPSPGFRVFAALRPLAGSLLLPISKSSGRDAGHLDALALRQPDGHIAVVLTNDLGRRAVTLHLRLAGLPARSTATIQTFSPDAPNGATTMRSLTPSDTRLTVPALGVEMVTISG